MASFDLGYPPSSHRSKRPGYNGTSLQEFFAAFPDDDACLEHIFRIRFGPDPQCPRCGGRGRWRRHEVQKHYFHPCGGVLSPMAGVIFSRSRIALQLWFYALLHFANSSESVAGPFLARQLGISEPTAFRVAQRIRTHMAALDHNQRLGAAGDTVIVRLATVLRITNPRRNTRNSANVLLLCDRNRVTSAIVERPSQKLLRTAIGKKVREGTHLVTDCHWTFRVLSNYSSGRPIAEHVPDYFLGRPPGENLSHGFMQYLNLSLSNQFRGVSLENAWLYFKEYEFRYNRRSRSADTFKDLISGFPSFDDRSLQQIKAANFIQASSR